MIVDLHMPKRAPSKVRLKDGQNTEVRDDRGVVLRVTQIREGRLKVELMPR